MNSQQWRNEYKYMVDTAQISVLRTRAMALMSMDSHVATNGDYARGGYNIRSVYFDDVQNSCYLENENGTDLREKFRIRIYNHSDNHIVLEQKSRRYAKCLKKSCLLSRSECNHLLRGEKLSLTDDSPYLLRKLMAQIVTRGLHPVVIVEYDRVPFVYPVGNVRVTLDCNLRASSECEQFFNPQLALRPILPMGMHVAEVKWDQLLPDHIYQALMLEGLQWSNVSKFFLCRKYSASEKMYK